MSIKELTEFIAHPSKDGKDQLLDRHNIEVAELTAFLASKIGLKRSGFFIGLLHDFGKYSASFQKYLRSAAGRISPDSENFIDPISNKGQIDHSTAGAQYLWSFFDKYGTNAQITAQVLALCLVSHHSGLIDCFKLDGTHQFLKRLKKSYEKTHLEECSQNKSDIMNKRLSAIVARQVIDEFIRQREKIVNKSSSEQINAFNAGFLTRMLFSCLVDADRINSAEFESPVNVKVRFRKPNWNIAISRLEQVVQNLKKESHKSPVNPVRERVSDECLRRSGEAQGLYTLTVPTGGGKTYSSLRYALHHARKFNLSRIIYIIPYTSIIEQNADAIRKVIEKEDDDFAWVLEHHSNLEQDKQTWHNKIAGENWDAPVILTTMVQFLEVLFAGGTSRVRRLHQLANSVLIFDEIQTLPVKTTHLFCNALNFLIDHCNTTALLCTATQPLLNQLKTPEKGQLSIPNENELIGDVAKLFQDLKRVEIKNMCKSSGWTKQEISDLALSKFEEFGSCLVIVNTKQWARQLYDELKNSVNSDSIYILSTNLCPAHRKEIFSEIKKRLNEENSKPVLCISTQLIEAGVDIDFASVIRFLAGLDSIAQAAGRCNRNGKHRLSPVCVLNPAEEKIDLLHDIKIGRDKARLVLDTGVKDVLSPEAIALYFKHYFYHPERSSEMVFPLRNDPEENILNLLSLNRNLPRPEVHSPDYPFLRQSFMLAGAAFKAIELPTKAVIVPHGKGKEIIAELCRIEKNFDLAAYKKCLRMAQQYSVNVFPNIWDKLMAAEALFEIQGDGIFYLKEEHYNKEFGLSVEPASPMQNLVY
jgi:CRISPR-associated endonuclease/helicase Cas3